MLRCTARSLDSKNEARAYKGDSIGWKGETRFKEGMPDGTRGAPICEPVQLTVDVRPHYPKDLE